MATAVLGTFYPNENDYMRHMDYVHWNTMKHDLMKQSKDWPYSSFHCYVRYGFTQKIGRGIWNPG